MSLNKIIVALAEKEYEWERSSPDEPTWKDLEPQLREDYLLRAAYVFGAVKDKCEIEEQWQLRYPPFDAFREDYFAMIADNEAEARQVLKVLINPRPDLVKVTTYTHVEVIDVDV